MQRNYPAISAHNLPRLFFEDRPAEEQQTAAEKKASAVLDHGRPVRCASCRSIITYQANAEAIAGSHVHSFVNPGGYEFTIGCYRKAWCRLIGTPTLEWSWFTGHRWQYALCPQCEEHLGWFYQNTAEQSYFYGLILNRLIIERAEGAAEH